MNEVYLVWEDNGESWEDYQSYVIAVCLTLEKAQSVLKEQGYVETSSVRGSMQEQPQFYGWWNKTTDFYGDPPKLEEFIGIYDNKTAKEVYEDELKWWSENKNILQYSITQTAWIEKFNVL